MLQCVATIFLSFFFFFLSFIDTYTHTSRSLRVYAILLLLLVTKTTQGHFPNPLQDGKEKEQGFCSLQGFSLLLLSLAAYSKQKTI